jgi:MoxR-like ATPase
MAAHDSILNLQKLVGKTVLGQEAMIERLIIGLLANGHLLVEGLPGLAKTRAIKKLSKFLDAGLSRIQFTPDLLPSDITGSEIYYSSEGKGEFRFQSGPIFNNLILADEINRAPAKVQSALLEAMEERQVTVAGKTHTLPQLFLVMATQNPIEQEGTYPLPEAQMDRFLMHVYVDYPAEKSERDIMLLVRGEEEENPAAPGSSAVTERIQQNVIFTARSEIHGIQMAAAVEQYIVADSAPRTASPASGAATRQQDQVDQRRLLAHNSYRGHRSLLVPQGMDSSLELGCARFRLCCSPFGQFRWSAMDGSLAHS